MSGPRESVRYETFELDHWLLSSHTEVSRWMEKTIGWGKVDHYETIMGNLVYQLRAYMTRQAEKPLMKTIKWPETWWDHLKDAKAPRWFKRKWPVRYHEEEVIAEPHLRICPHLKADALGKHMTHILINDAND